MKIIVVESGKVYSCNVNAGDKIVLHYIHSIYMKDIYEVFEVNTACEFILKEIIIGNNSYTVIEPKDLEDCYMNAESFIIQNLNIKLKSLNIRIGEIGKPTIIVNNYKFSLYNISGFGSLIIITVDSH
ncbi:MAG: DUF1850 domain-containing protein [Candidatus Methanomethylicia archaeon]